MKINRKCIEKLLNLLKAQRGVLSKADLEAIISPTSSVDFYRQMKKLIKERIIRKVSRGFYVGEDFSLGALIMNMRPNSYLSLEYGLSFYNMIGTYSPRLVRPISTTTIRSIESDFLKIEFKKISESLNFGLTIRDGVRIADPEKTILDTLYFYQSGTRYYFDIYSDIDTSGLDRTIIEKYLMKYKNPKFKSFVRNFFDEQDKNR